MSCRRVQRRLSASRASPRNDGVPQAGPVLLTPDRRQQDVIADRRWASAHWPRSGRPMRECQRQSLAAALPLLWRLNPWITLSTSSVNPSVSRCRTGRSPHTRPENRWLVGIAGWNRSSRQSTRPPCTRHMPEMTPAGPTCPVAPSAPSKATETGRIPFLRPMTPCSSRSSTKAKPVGVASYMRIMPSAGSIEVGHVNFSPALQRSAVATEAMYLMMETAFRLGYRRYEWKCDDLNAASRAAARRLGFSYEGTFRQATVYKGRSRDTAWFSIIDTEWPALRERSRRGSTRAISIRQAGNSVGCLTSPVP